VALHIERRRGHDWARATGMISDWGGLWLEVSHDGRTRRVDVTRAPDDGASGQSMLSTKAVYDGPGYRVRACGDNAKVVRHSRSALDLLRRRLGQQRLDQ
jgi:hypothetical protein